MFAFIAAGSIVAATVAATTSLEPMPARPASIAAPVPHAAVPEHKIYGFVQSLGGTTLIIRNRSGAAVVVDAHLARSSIHIVPGRPVIVFGTVDPKNGIVHAARIWRTFPDAAHWPADR